MRSAVALLGLLLPVLLAAQRQTAASGGNIPVPLPQEQQTATSVTHEPQIAVFRARVLDGRTAAPMQGVHLLVWYDEQVGAGTLLVTGVDGIVALPAPVMEPIRVLISMEDRIDCREHTSVQVPIGFNLKAIAAKGESAENTCGRFAVHTKPGELVLFARKPRWYEQINRDLQP